MGKLVRLMVPWFAKGFACPLLSRFKHYGPASSYIKVGCTLFGLLPRILRAMTDNTKQVSADLSSMIDTLLADTKISASAGKFSEADLQVLLSGLMEADMSYSLQNSVRKNTMIKAVCAPRFSLHAVIIDCLLQPIEVGINKLFARSKLLHEAANLGSARSQYKDLLHKSRTRFMQVVRGELGHSLMAGYMKVLHRDLAESISFGFDFRQSPAELRLAFELVVVGITDCWRRLVLEFCAPPWSLFVLSDLPTAEFVESWLCLHQKFATCSYCFDDAFSTVLLTNFPADEFLHKPLAHQEAVAKEIKQVLVDIATWAPLSSDLVEIKNGVVQWVVSRRGKQQVKSPVAARETTFLQSCVKQFHWLKHIVQEKTMPPKSTSSGILKMSGAQCTNQYSKDSGKATCLIMPRLDF